MGRTEEYVGRKGIITRPYRFDTDLGKARIMILGEGDERRWRIEFVERDDHHIEVAIEQNDAVVIRTEAENIARRYATAYVNGDIPDE